jgi:hypothetical protein
MTLIRNDFREDGIFGVLLDDLGNQIAVTLEHAYVQADSSYQPKLGKGMYQCMRGEHQLAGMSQPFETFEITGVPGHTDILFHRGNYNADSAGCVLLGNAVSENMITNSKLAFYSFMVKLNGIDTFTLTVDPDSQ